MAKLNDTSINGKLDVTEDVNIGDMSVKEELSKLNSNIMTNEYGTAIIYTNGLVEQFGRTVLDNANDYVAMKTITLPVAIDLVRDYAANVSRHTQGNSAWSLNTTVSVNVMNNEKITLTLQNSGAGFNNESELYRTVQWHIIGFTLPDD